MLRYFIAALAVSACLVAAPIRIDVELPPLEVNCHVLNSQYKNVYEGGESDPFCKDFIPGEGLSLYPDNTAWATLEWYEFLPDAPDPDGRSHVAWFNGGVMFAVSGSYPVSVGDESYTYWAGVAPFSLSVPIRGMVPGEGRVLPPMMEGIAWSSCDGAGVANVNWTSNGFQRGVEDELLGTFHISSAGFARAPLYVAWACGSTTIYQHWWTVENGSPGAIPEPSAVVPTLLFAVFASIRRIAKAPQCMIAKRQTNRAGKWEVERLSEK